MDITTMYFDKPFTNMNKSNVNDYLNHVNVHGTDAHGKDKIYTIGIPFPSKCPYKHKNSCVDYKVIKVTHLHKVGILAYEYTFAVLYKCTLCGNYLAVNYDEVCEDPVTPNDNALIIPYFFNYINKYPFSSQQKSIIHSISPMFKINYLIGETDFYRYRYIINDYSKSNAFKEHLYKIYCNDCRKELEIFIRGLLKYEKKVWTKKFNDIKFIANKELSKIVSKKKFDLHKDIDLICKINKTHMNFNSINKIKNVLPRLKSSKIINDSLGKNISKLTIVNSSLGKLAKFLSEMGNFGSHADIKKEKETYKQIKLSQIHQLMYNFVIIATNKILNNQCKDEVKKNEKIFNGIKHKIK